MKVTFSGIAAPRRGSLVLFAAEGPEFAGSATAIDSDIGGLLGRAATIAGFKGRKATFLDLVAPPGLAADRIVVAGLGDPAALTEYDWVSLGGALAGHLAGLHVASATVRFDLAKKLAGDPAEAAARIALGMRLRTYRFDHYKSKSENGDKTTSLDKVVFQTASPASGRKAYADVDAIVGGVHFARDLVNEPPNVLYPAEFAKRLKLLDKNGLSVEVLRRKDLEKLKMGALLAVAQGSRREPCVAVMRYDGGGKEAPIAFIGKGVTFDTGGISIKPAASMGDMKGDMAGAACVAGLMRALAARKARVNAVGLVGLVENMPDGLAFRPGDVVTSMSGQTIEVLNTDAEGRLVLADVIHYAIDRFKPSAIVDLATLTGAVIVALGKHHAGLFATDDELADRLLAAGEATGERVWRLPLGSDYDKLIDSTIADMKNTGGRHAGAITAAQFIRRYVGDTPWAHLDIAGTGMDSAKTQISRSFGTGFGVRLLDRLVTDHYEKR